MRKYGQTLRQYLLECNANWFSVRWKIEDENRNVLTEDLMECNCNDPIMDMTVKQVYKNPYAVLVRVNNE